MSSENSSTPPNRATNGARFYNYLANNADKGLHYNVGNRFTKIAIRLNRDRVHRAGQQERRAALSAAPRMSDAGAPDVSVVSPDPAQNSASGRANEGMGPGIYRGVCSLDSDYEFPDLLPQDGRNVLNPTIRRGY